MDISLCMIVKNEEDVLASCLKSAVGVVSEIVIVDTGSVDQTKGIAAKFGARIIDYKWTGNFSDARNVSLSAAGCSHILVLDADEVLESGEGELHRFILENPDDAAKIICRNEIDGEMVSHPQIRLFPNDSSYRYEGAVHEELRKDGQPVVGKPSDIAIFHRGYEKERYKRKNKKDFYLDLYQTELQKNPKDGYTHYQIAKLLYSTESYSDAIPYFERCLEFREEDHLYFPPMIVLYGYTLQKTGKSALAQEIAIPFLDKYSDFPDLFFLIGMLAIDTGNLANMELAFSECIRIGETRKYVSAEGAGSFKALHNLGVYYEVTGNIKEACRFYDLAGEYGYQPSLQRLLHCQKK